MELRYRTNFDRPLRMLQGLVISAKDATPALRRIVGKMRSRARDRFRGLVSPGLSRSYQKKLEQTRTSAITAAGNVRASFARNQEAQLRKKGASEMTLAELRRLARGGSTAFSLAEQQEASIERLRKKLAHARATGKRVGGDRRRSDKHQLLGRLRTALEGKIHGFTAILENRIPWSRVHNDGGTAGKGARIPARATLFILAEDVAAFAQIALDALMGRKS
jgi:phage gpG-like protein